MMLKVYLTCCLAVGLVKPLIAQTPDQVNPADDNRWKEFTVSDSLKIQKVNNDDVMTMLKDLSWTPETFKVRMLSGTQSPHAWLLFDSPKPSGQETVDRVHVEWYQARDENGKVKKAPAILVMHSIHPKAFAGRTIAKGLAKQGIHAFLVQSPMYMQRRPQGSRRDPLKFIDEGVQWVADARRARDVILQLPEVEGDSIDLQGTSLGGYAATVLAGMDDAFDRVFISLAGVGLKDVVLEGKRDAARVRNFLASGGLTGQKLIDQLYRIEPARIAHRLNPDKLWLYNGHKDQVVPMKNALKLAELAKVNQKHHRWYKADHYTAFFYFPAMISDIARQIQMPRVAEAPQKDQE